MLFPVSGVEVFPLVPPLVAFGLSFLTSMGGVSGAFLLLPFQVSVLGFTSPAVSPTNMIFNIVAIPGGVYRYLREGRMAWPIVWIVTAGTLPGIYIGAVLRVRFLPDPAAFKLFVGCVLLYIGARLVFEAGKRGGLTGSRERTRRIEDALREGAGRRSADARIRTRRIGLSAIEYSFLGESVAFSPLALCGLALVVGVVGGAYGIGGGAIIAPFLVAVFGLPVYTIAGATLMSTFLASIAGVAIYTFMPETGGTAPAAPDFALGALFGVGGLAGTYCGARLQSRVPARAIKAILAACMMVLALRYVIGFFL